MDETDEIEIAEHSELLRHNAEFDAWESLTDAEREARIRWALR